MDTPNPKTLKRTLVVLLAASLAVPAYAGGPRHAGPHGRPGPHQHHPAPKRHHDSGAGLALLLGAVVGIAAIAAATAEPAPRPVIVQAPPPAPAVMSPPPMVAVPAPRPAYSVWYYCREANGYYPQVRACPSPWVAVAPSMLPPQPTAY